MTDEEKKALDEAYDRAYDYDPDEEDLKKKYSDEFVKKWLE